MVTALVTSSMASSSWKAGCRSNCLTNKVVMNSCMSKASWEGMETLLQAGVTTGGPWERGWGVEGGGVSTWGSALEGAIVAREEVTTNIIKRELAVGDIWGSWIICW